jgi:hypothetical protein
MTTRNNTGIMNSKSHMQDYVRDLRIQPVAPQPKTSPVNAICDMILNKVGEQAYNEWLDTTPDDNDGFHRAAVEKLSNILGIKIQ